jgi:DNA adenine methylase
MIFLNHFNQTKKKKVVITSPPLRYPGGKWRLASWIIKQFPPHVCYVEPFAGGASVLFSKKPSTIEVINDLNDEVINFFQVLRDCPEQLIYRLTLTPFAKQELRQAYDPTDDPIEKARRFYIRTRQGFGMGSGSTFHDTGWRFQADDNRGTLLIGEWGNLDALWGAAMRLKRVQVDKDDALTIIQRYDRRTTLFYADPPYVMSARSGKKYYSEEMTDAQHRALADALHSVSGMVILSGYASPLYAELYGDWRMISKTTKTNGNGSATECLWMSPNADALEHYPLFSTNERQS